MTLDNKKNVEFFFNKKWYAAKYANSDDYLQDGWKLARNPSKNFNTSAYLEVFESSTTELTQNPITHLGEIGFFNAYKTKVFGEITAQLKFLVALPEFSFLRLVVDENWYLSKNPDVYNAGFHPLYHYYYFGINEGRMPSPDVSISDLPLTTKEIEDKVSLIAPRSGDEFSQTVRKLYLTSSRLLNKYHPDANLTTRVFDATWYLNKNPDVKEMGIEPFFHFINYGWKEGRNPCTLFDVDTYLSSEAGFREILISTGGDPLQHLIEMGVDEKRPLFNNKNHVGAIRYQCSTAPKLFEKSNVVPNSFLRSSAVFIHCFYPEIGDELIKSCIARGLKVYVSFVERTNYKYLIEKYPTIEWKVFENRGRDIYPFFEGFKNEILSHKYVLHLHTKKSLHYGVERSDWLHYCQNSLLGNLNLVNDILSSPANAIVFPEPPDFVKDVMNWGGNFDRVNAILERLNIKANYWDNLDFPAGSMFWMDTEKLNPILTISIPKYLYESESGQVDGTLPHAIERFFGVFCLKSKLSLVPIRDKSDDNFTFSDRKKDRDFLVQENPKYSPSYNLALSHYYSELTPFSFTSSKNETKRLNILVPTLEPQHIFGGIATALKFFYKLAERLNFDTRIITTDSICTNSIASNYPSYSNFTLQYSDDEDPNHIISAVPRECGSLVIRPNDIFIGTAWWTINHLDQINEFQRIECDAVSKHIYLVQDYEPHFYGWSSKSQLADNTYNNEYIKVYNTQLLRDYFYQRNKHSGIDFTLRPSLNENIKNCLLSNEGNEKKKIVCFYGRPSAERNCIEIIFEALAIIKYKIPDEYDDWTFYSLGESYESDIASELQIKILGKLSLEAYAELISESFIGISLMVSPHPSYPPFEMAAAAMHVYTNYYDNKEKLNNSFIHVGNCNPLDLSEFILDRMNNFDSRPFKFSFDEKSYGEGQSLVNLVESLSKVLN